MRKALIIILVLALPFVFVPGSFAQDETPEIYKPFMKLGRGLINIVSCPLEIPKQAYLLSRDGRAFWKTTAQGLTGIFVGSGWAVYRLGAGAIDVVTFPFPYYDHPVIDPAYVF